MKIVVVLVLLGGLCSAFGQEGTIPRWEIVEVAENLDQSAQAVEKILTRIRPKEWIQDGAPEIYVSQHETLRADVANLALSVREMIRKPEKLSAAISTFLWLDRVGPMVDSLAAGVRKYQNTALADLLESSGAKALSGEDRFKQYMRQRAVDQETELAIADHEAQRCRSEMLKRPVGRD